MNKRLLTVIGIIGGIIALVGVYSPREIVSERGSNLDVRRNPASGSIQVDTWKWENTLEISAMDSVTMAELWVEDEYWGQVDFRFNALLVLIGAVLILVGALATIARPEVSMLWSIVFTGGVLVIICCVWAFIDLRPETVDRVSYSYGYGLYLTTAGGILGLPGILGKRISDY